MVKSLFGKTVLDHHLPKLIEGFVVQLPIVQKRTLLFEFFINPGPDRKKPTEVKCRFQCKIKLIAINNFGHQNINPFLPFLDSTIYDEFNDLNFIVPRFDQGWQQTLWRNFHPFQSDAIICLPFILNCQPKKKWITCISGTLFLYVILFDGWDSF